jgi:hypothetical protein
MSSSYILFLEEEAPRALVLPPSTSLNTCGDCHARALRIHARSAAHREGAAAHCAWGVLPSLFK